jgi:hypothetical protein
VNYDVQRVSMEIAALLKDRLGAPSHIPDGDGGVQLEWHQDGWDIECWISHPTPATESEKEKRDA